MIGQFNLPSLSLFVLYLQQLSAAPGQDALCFLYDWDCYGCVESEGCSYCPEDGNCYDTSSLRSYASKLEGAQCTKMADFLDEDDGRESCIGPDAFHKDPLYAGSKWMFDMINLEEVWETYGISGEGVTIRINDSGVYVDNKEFEGRFDDVENSCPEYLPYPTYDSHGTAVAGIILGNADNDLCGVGVASQAKFSSCSIYKDDYDNSYMSYKLETFDISQNSWGYIVCIPWYYDSRDLKNECPFTYASDYVCDVCDGEFLGSRENMSEDCIGEIRYYCLSYYKEDEACVDFLDIILDGDCYYAGGDEGIEKGFEDGIKDGRNGKGIIFVFASGNEFEIGGDTNMSFVTNSRYTISVGAVGKDRFHSHFSTPGAAVFVSAPSGDERDIGNLMTTGIGVDVCEDSGLGTSFSCPVVSGVIALMLEANPNLTWRDVQGILAATSNPVQEDDEDDTQITNAAGVWHSDWYGFGIVDALGAVEAAMEWKPYKEEEQATGTSDEGYIEISDSEGNEITSMIELDPDNNNFSEDFVAESTVILISLIHSNRGELEIELESPSGTVSILHPGEIPSEISDGQLWKLMTLKNWGEDPTGEWKLRIRDLMEQTGNGGQIWDTYNYLRGWQIVVYGRSSGLTKSPTASPTESPTKSPTESPTKSPTNRPTTKKPTPRPTTKKPTPRPTTKRPTKRPTSSTTADRRN